MSNHKTKSPDENNFRVMKLLQDNPDMTQRELAQKLGISLGGLNFCLKALIDKGWIKMHNFSQSKNKFGYVYLLTPSGMTEKVGLTVRFLDRKVAEYESLTLEIAALKSEVSQGQGKPASIYD
jgi:EPS-associated MarR family transcriptional regulator